MNPVTTSPAASPPATAQGSWLTQLSGPERSTLFATFGGWALDGMDVIVYRFVIPSLIAAWHISKGQAGLLGTAALLISAIGGWLAGTLADRYGRARILQLTIIWFAFFTFLSGFTHSFTQLLVTRGLQGLGFGGEWAVGSVLMGEAIRSQHRGKAVGTVQGGWAVGWGLAAICYTVLFKALPEATAWRAMFWIGILPALLVFYIRRRVPEPKVYAETRKKVEASGANASFLQIFSPDMLKITLLTSLLAVGAQGGYYAITTWLPTFLKTQRKLSVMNTGAYLIVVIVGSFIGYMVSAYLADRIGRKKTLILYAVGSFVTVVAYTYLPISNDVMRVLGFPLGFFASGVFSPIGAFFTELFPSRLRGSGQGFSYNFGRGVGALFPTLVGFLSASVSLGHAIATFAASAYLVMILGTALLPETRGKELHVYE
ncbi:MAG TPA: MFS transporter [Terriglobales bacterium]|nr:MFS transporter [Terriglobales bacterium]